jgi:hypothetical protein
MSPTLACGLRLLAILCVAGSAPACSGTIANLATTTAPSTTPSTDTFSGTLSRNGAFTYPFAALQPGTVTASYTSVGTDNSITLGLGLGTWNGSACQILIANDNATAGVLVSALANAAGSLCVRVYDVGYVVNPLSYEVKVVHP